MLDTSPSCSQVKTAGMEMQGAKALQENGAAATVMDIDWLSLAHYTSRLSRAPQALPSQPYEGQATANVPKQRQEEDRQLPDATSFFLITLLKF